MRALRVAAAQISHETNVFSSVRTDLAAFARSGQLLDAEIVMKERGTNSAFGGFTIGAANLGFELLPMVSVWATPSGIVTAEAFEALSHMLLDRLRHLLAHRGIDGVALALHGAMVSENDMDGDALLLERVRETVGGDIPIVGTLDLHANISERMLNAADVLVGYDTYPHVDMAERAEEACHILDRLMRGQLRPAVALVKPPMLPTSQRMMTSQEPMRALLALAHEIERDGRIVNVTLAGGFPASDVPDAGLSVLVTTTGDADFALASADRLARAAWEVREQFLGGVLTFATAAARIRDGGAADKPWLLVDIGDNPWSGSPRDSAELVRFLIAEQIDGAAVAMVVDPESVRRCITAGLGAEVDLVLGGKTDALHGAPLRIRGRVRSIDDGRYVNAGPMMAGLAVDLGPTVVMSTTGLAIEILITSRAESPIDLNVFRANGIEPTECPLIALKGKGHFRAAFEPIAREVLLVEGPGISGSDLSRLPFKNVARPIWPLDPEVEYE